MTLMFSRLESHTFLLVRTSIQLNRGTGRLLKNEVLKQIQIERSEPRGVGTPKNRVFRGEEARASS